VESRFGAVTLARIFGETRRQRARADRTAREGAVECSGAVSTDIL